MDRFSYKKYEPLFGSWYIKDMLGMGSYGTVYELERQDFGATYKAALKAITIPQSQNQVDSLGADGMDEASVASYFRQVAEEVVGEFVLMSKLKGNSNIVSYEDHIVIPHKEGIGWDILIRMELLTPLIAHVRSNKLAPNDVVKFGIDLCRALEICQKHNIIHRDIKPENIFISDNGDYKLGDFGIARTLERTTGALSKKGTFTYMAPEIYIGREYGSSVDIYSLGIVMYWLLNENRTPFLPSYPATITPRDREQALLMRIRGDAPPPPCMADGRLAEIVLKMCAFNPKERYDSLALLRADLEGVWRTDVIVAEQAQSEKAALPVSPSSGLDSTKKAKLVAEPEEYTPLPVYAAPQGRIGGESEETAILIEQSEPERVVEETVFVEPENATNIDEKAHRNGKKTSSKIINIIGAILVVMLLLSGIQHLWWLIFSPDAPPDTLHIDDSPQIVNLENFWNRPYEEARSWLANIDIPATIVFDFHDTVPEGYVIRTSPRVGTLSALSTVTITVSRGPYTIPEAEPEPTEPLPAPEAPQQNAASTSTPTAGSIMQFGGHTWRVLDVQGNRALLLSEYVLEERAYHHTLTNVTWENSSLRHHLNNEFFNSFSVADRTRILQVRNINSNNPWYGTNGGNDTYDRIFLLSLEEVVRYFGDSGQLANRPLVNPIYNMYALAIDDQYNSRRVAHDTIGNARNWWLRSPAQANDLVVTIDFIGNVHISGRGGDVSQTTVVRVRPALWLSLES